MNMNINQVIYKKDLLPVNYKSTMCPNIYDNEKCEDKKCIFSHNISELRNVLCYYDYFNGSCKHSICKYRHYDRSIIEYYDMSCFGNYNKCPYERNFGVCRLFDCDFIHFNTDSCVFDDISSD